MGINGDTFEAKVHDINDARDPRALEGVYRAFSGIMRRALMGRLTSFEGKRNYQQIFGWDSTITAENMLYMYNRGGIAKRLVDAYPDAVWARPPVIWANGDDQWSADWANFAEDIGLWNALYRLDKLAGLGHYAILLLGTDKPGLERPLRNPKQITFLQPYGQTSAQISKWNKDSTSPDFGRPTSYRIYPDTLSGTEILNSGVSTPSPSRSSFMVHSSRVLHIARGTLEDDIYGQPLMAPSWDYLTDLRKVVGSSSESYWISANRGLQADVDKDMALSSTDQAALQDEIDEFINGFRRFVRTKGVKLETLKNDLANPKDPFDVLVTLISGTSGIPKRILLGSEAGQLASTQDKGNWAERIEENRALHIEPTILKPLLKKMLELKLIRPPKEGANIGILWPDAYRMSPLERGQTSAQTARTIANVVKMLESKSSRAANLLNDTEIRALLGFSTDNRILADDPDP